MGAYRRRHLCAVFSFIIRPLALAIFVTLIFRLLSSSPSPRPSTLLIRPKPLTKALVIASTANQPPSETSWISQVPSDWQVHTYNTDLPGVVPLNKGNEAMPCLTYIIDHYSSLPDIVFFHHSHFKSWHQTLDSLTEVQSLRASYVRQAGFVSTRCLPGCENLIPVAEYAVDFAMFARVGRDVQLASLFDEFINRTNGESVPTRIAAPCCAQFAVSKERILRREREWWVKLRDWLVYTPLGDLESGRLLEYTWHVWMGAEPEL